MSLLARDPALWDIVFNEPVDKVRLVQRVMKRAGNAVLDVGCATGSVCRLLRERGAKAVGLDINSRFVTAARRKDPNGEYHVENMRNFELGQRFDLIICLGTTFAYNLTTQEVLKTLQNFKAHLKPGGYVVIDVLNAAAFLGPRPFQPCTQHKSVRDGFRATATIRHSLDLRTQRMTEQVSWRINGKHVRRDSPERQRLFFPQELRFYLEAAGFDGVRLTDSYGQASKVFHGRRLIAVARVRKARR